MAKIGKLDKPDVSSFKNKKKLFFVRNLYLPQNATDKYKNIFHRYWDEVEEHLEKLEVAGKISKIFCESIYMTGEESLKVLNAMNMRLGQIVKKKIDAGGRFLPLEDKELFGAYMDWSNCHMIVRTPRVHKAIDKLLNETVLERFEHIKSVLSENIVKGESGLLIMREEDRKSLELPVDFGLFLVTPPAYDDLLQYIRDSENGKEFWRTG
ncbi:MAG: hypothetical protein HY808_02365 [Nitrospirae bacterium]|nr:hypothetical protein [Nitrospirota bacterium]